MESEKSCLICIVNLEEAKMHLKNWSMKRRRWYRKMTSILKKCSHIGIRWVWRSLDSWIERRQQQTSKRPRWNRFNRMVTLKDLDPNKSYLDLTKVQIKNKCRNKFQHSWCKSKWSAKRSRERRKRWTMERSGWNHWRKPISTFIGSLLHLLIW